MIGAADEHAHAVAPQAFQTWKENWCLCAVDPAQRFAAVFHVSLRPVTGEGVFSAKLYAGGHEFKHVRRHPIGPDPRALMPLADGALTVTLGDAPRVELELDEVSASLEFTGRFGVFDFADGPLAPGPSTLGDIGRHVFPFNHYEQGLDVRGVVRFGGEEVVISGRGNRDHSWGFRDDFGFRHHHWICANFDSCFVGGSAMVETSYDGLKHGGAVASADGHDPIAEVDESGAYWLAPGEALPDLDRDVTYTLRTLSGRELTVTAHVSSPYALLYLNARSEDRTQLYQDRQVFCDYTLHETGERGCGVLELGKYLVT